MIHLFRFMILVTCLILAACATTSQPMVGSMSVKGQSCGSREELKEHVTSFLWQWDGDVGEKIIFNGNGYIEHPGWTRRGLVTKWEVIDRRTVLLEIESGRSRDLYAVLVFSEDMSSFEGFNFHGGARLRKSISLGGLGAEVMPQSKH